MLKVKKILCEDKENPLGIDVSNPKFNFVLESKEKNVYFTSFHIQVSEYSNFKSKIVWDSGKKSSDKSVYIYYDGLPLKAHCRYYIRVKVWDNKGNVSKWSETNYFDTTFINGSSWAANFIGSNSSELYEECTCMLFRKNFYLIDKVKFAKAYVTAKGLYEMKLNGNKVGNDFFTPGFTNYNYRLQYQTYEITNDLKKGDNAIGITLGDGWYKGYVNWNQKRNFFGDRKKLLIEIHIQYKGGGYEKIISDDTFKWFYSPIQMSEFYHGEKYDARREQVDFAKPTFNDNHFYPVAEFDDTKNILIAQQNESVQVVDVIKPKSIFKTPADETILDMGQIMVGQLRIKVQGNSGDKLVLKHGETLDNEGNFYFENIGDSVGEAKQEIHYTLKGGGLEEYNPHFTYQCFRYVHIVDFPCEPLLNYFEGLVLSSFDERVGYFECSNQMVNQLYKNIIWTQRGNFMDIPIAGPQRAERIGWTGDAQFFAKTACYNMNAKLFYQKWLDDLRYEQFPNGSVPLSVPNVLGKEEYEGLVGLNEKVEKYPTSSAWGDASLIIPWLLYVNYGDIETLQKHYPSMKKYVEFMRNSGKNEYTFETGFQYGDWFSLDAEDGSYAGATPKEFIATAFYANSVSILIKTANLLNYMDDYRTYSLVYKRIVQEFRNKYVAEDGDLLIKTQSAYVLALHFHLVGNQYRELITDKLVQSINKFNNNLSTGFVTTPYLCHVLSSNGYVEKAYELLLKENCPSWLYQVKMGATTVWEHWDSIKPDGSFWDPWMNSFNHTAFGSIGDWLFSVICGIRPDENNPGYRHFYINPKIGGGMTFAKGKLKTVFGKIEINWKLYNDMMSIFVQVPIDTSATILLPSQNKYGSNEVLKRQIAEEGYTFNLTDDNQVIIKVGSGEYNFYYRY